MLEDEKMQLSDEQLKEFKEAFSLFDAKGNGSISEQDLGVVMRSLGQNPTEKEIETMIKEVDVDGNGEVDFSEFVQMMKTQMKNRDANRELMEAFQVFDCNRNGRISPTELKDTMKNLGQELTEEQLKLMILEADYNGDGVIDFEEFKKLVTTLDKAIDAPARVLVNNN
ncbi:neo-calmodulin-like isoform X2 [Rhopilema esculentum]|uniref:neo-calmodulin-like isoform X2 n=1 Tax=Rhopilema esculentum TaxID=499914 RepID=UPI0031E1CFDF